MVTILKRSGLRVVIFTDDHEPAHVHVFGDGEVKINLTEDGVELVWAYHMTRRDVRQSLALVAEHREAILAKWRAIHG